MPKSYRPPLRDYATLGALLAKQGQGLEAAAALFVAAQDAARVDAGADATALRCVLSDALERLGPLLEQSGYLMRDAAGGLIEND